MHSAPGVGGTFRIQIFMSGEPPRFIGITFKPVKWALLALKVSGERLSQTLWIRHSFAASFDHLIGNSEQFVRNSEAEHARGLCIDN
jgi:hypothetical protein